MLPLGTAGRNKSPHARQKAGKETLNNFDIQLNETLAKCVENLSK